MHSTLLVAGQDMANLLGVVKRIVDLQSLAAGIAEDQIDPLGL